jgi:hypothetical protein
MDTALDLRHSYQEERKAHEGVSDIFDSKLRDVRGQIASFSSLVASPCYVNT